MSVQRSERIAATVPKPTQEPIQPARTWRQPTRQSTGGRGPLRLANPGPQYPRLRSGVKRTQDNADGGNNADLEDEGMDESVDEGMDESVDDDDGSLTDPARVKQPFIKILSLSEPTSPTGLLNRC